MSETVSGVLKKENVAIKYAKYFKITVCMTIHAIS